MEILRNINSWPEFTSLLSGLGKKEKGDAFEELSLHYLRLHPTYTTQLETVWHHRNVPPKIRRELNLPATDEGIDLIARTREGSYWAIQCKYHEDENHSLTRKELATFTDLAFGVCKGFELALVCTSADRFSHKLALHGERISYIAGDRWRELDSEFFTRLHRTLANRPISIKPYTPRPHQKEALKEAVSHFLKAGNERGKLIMPCGSGKSLTGWWLAEKLGARTVLVAVPSLSLVKQTLEVWARESVAHSRSIRWIAVCSDESVAHDNRDDAAVLVQDLGVRVHTNPQEIAGWLKHPHDGITVVFTTYQSGRAIAEASRNASVAFDLGILDEAHKTVGKRGSLFDHLLHDENIDIHRRIFMTATERRYRGDSDNILSMDDPASYGDTFHLLSFKSALECVPPILSDYKIVTVAVTRAEIANLVRANLLVRPDKGEWNDDLEAEMLASLVALRKAMQNYPIRHAVSFHSSISRAKAFQDSQNLFTSSFPEYGELETFHVTGSAPTSKRKREIDAFAKSERSLITNARCLTEGVDIPGIDCILFADPKRSTVDIVQAVGRALRPAMGKEYGYVVIPVVANDYGIPEETRFDSVLMVLRALATSDERIVEFFRAVSQGRHNTEKSPIKFFVPDGIKIDADVFVNSIELMAWGKLAKLSWRPFEEARDFARGLRLESPIEWQRFCYGMMPQKGTLPNDVPRNPIIKYKDNGWVDWVDWLGIRIYKPFNEARDFVRGLGIETYSEWEHFSEGRIPQKGTLPDDIPRNPNTKYYKKGWVNWDDWLGIRPTIIKPFEEARELEETSGKYKPFEEARDFARGLRLESPIEWQRFCYGMMPQKGTLPNDVPRNPIIKYKDNGWVDWDDWLGISPTIIKSFKEARDFSRGLRLKKTTQWRLFCEGKLPDIGTLPDDVPRNPNIRYKDNGWLNWDDWLGISPTIIKSFKEARDFARGLRLKNSTYWLLFCEGKLPDIGTLPDYIPRNPNIRYKDNGWVNWDDWLGIRIIKPFEDAREFARGLSLKNSTQWLLFCEGKLPDKGRLPHDIPETPYLEYYKKGWVSWSDWLGTTK